MYHLNVKSEYSKLESMLSINQIVSFFDEQKYTYASLVDDNLSGMVKFLSACKEKNIKPIIGLDINVKINDFVVKIILYAITEEGLRNIINISSLNTDLIKKYEEIVKYKSGIYVAISTKSKYVNENAHKNISILQDLYNIISADFDNVFFGISILNSKEENVSNAISSNFKSIILDETRVISKEDNLVFHKRFKIYKTKSVLRNSDYHFLTKSEIEKYDFNNVIENTKSFIDEIALEDINLSTQLPSYCDNSDELLSKLCNESLKGKGVLSEEYALRLEEELNVISELGFSDYFLIVYDLVKYAKDKNIIIGPGRGSACSSLVSYLLDITEIDPIKYGLIFERFLNKDRVSMPDIDIDIEDTSRNEVIDYLRDKYGNDRVLNIIVFKRLNKKILLNETSKIVPLSKQYISELSDILINSNLPIKAQIKNNDTLKSLLNHKEIREFIDYAISIENSIITTSVHPAGVILSDKSYINNCPVIKEDNSYMTQLEHRDLESLNYLKIDLLSLSTLTNLKNIISKIQESDPNFKIENIPLDDNKTFDMLTNKETFNIFQLESRGMQDTLSKLKITSIDDLILALALYRPGPMDNIDLISKRKNSNVKYNIDDSIKEILNDTYGIIVYQEQIMNIAKRIANYDFKKADLFRRAISKKDNNKLEELKKDFIESSINNNISDVEASNIFEQIKKFANYGFAKSHASAYALLTYRIAYLKANYPLQFYLNVLSTNINDTKIITKCFSDLYSKGLKLLPIDINKSNYSSSLENNSLRLGLSTVKSIPSDIKQKLINNRPKGGYTSIENFVTTNKDILKDDFYKSLVFSNAFDCFKYTKQHLINNFKSYKYSFTSVIDKEEILLNDEEYSIKKLVKEEFNSTSLNIKYFLLDEYKDYITKKEISTPSNLAKKNKFILMGVVSSFRETKTKNDNLMCFISLADKFNTVDLVIFPDEYSRVDDIEENMIAYCEVTKQVKNNTISYIVNSIKLNNLI